MHNAHETYVTPTYALHEFLLSFTCFRGARQFDNLKRLSILKRHTCERQKNVKLCKTRRLALFQTILFQLRMNITFERAYCKNPYLS